MKSVFVFPDWTEQEKDVEHCIGEKKDTKISQSLPLRLQPRLYRIFDQIIKAILFQ